MYVFIYLFMYLVIYIPIPIPIHIHIHTQRRTYTHTHTCLHNNDMLTPSDTSPHQDSAGTATSGTQPPAQPPPPHQTRGTQSHSVPTLLDGLCSTQKGKPARLNIRVNPNRSK